MFAPRNYLVEQEGCTLTNRGLTIGQPYTPSPMNVWLSAEGNKNYNVLLLYRFCTRFVPRWPSSAQKHALLVTTIESWLRSLSIYRCVELVLDIIIVIIIKQQTPLPHKDLLCGCAAVGGAAIITAPINRCSGRWRELWSSRVGHNKHNESGKAAGHCSRCGLGNLTRTRVLLIDKMSILIRL